MGTKGWPWGATMRDALIALCVSGLVALCAQGGALAAPRAEETSERRAAAAEFKRGKQLYAAKDYDAALSAFQHGYELYPLRGFLVNIGQCQRRLGQLRDAAESYEKFLEEQGGSPALRAEVEEALAEVREAERSAPRAPVSGWRASTESVLAPAAPPSAPSALETPEVPPGAELRADQPAQPKRRRWVAAVIATSAVLVAGGIAVGVYFGVRAQQVSGGSLGLLDGRQP